MFIAAERLGDELCFGSRTEPPAAFPSTQAIFRTWAILEQCLLRCMRAGGVTGQPDSTSISLLLMRFALLPIFETKV